MELFRALAASGPSVPKPTPLDKFLAAHPKAARYITARTRIPTSFARESFFAVSAFKFTNAAGVSRFGDIEFDRRTEMNICQKTMRRKNHPIFCSTK